MLSPCCSVQSVQLRALLCTNNMVSLLSTADLGGVCVLQELWGRLSRLTASQTGKEPGRSHLTASQTGRETGLSRLTVSHR